MTTTIDAPTTGKRVSDPLDDNVHPALGETWGSICTHRIRLYDRGGGQQRYARMFKSPTMQEQTAAFHIGPDGIADVVDPIESENKAGGGGVHAGEDDDMDFGHTSTQSMLFWDDFS